MKTTIIFALLFASCKAAEASHAPGSVAHDHIEGDESPTNETYLGEEHENDVDLMNFNGTEHGVDGDAALEEHEHDEALLAQHDEQLEKHM